MCWIAKTLSRIERAKMRKGQVAGKNLFACFFRRAMMFV
jgi:hypothetical protein